MEWFQAVVLGIVQGLTEFLPISSSAHLRIVPELFGWEDPGAAFTAVIQIGSELAIIVYFARDIVRIIRAWSLSLWFMSLRGTESMRGSHHRRRCWDPVDARMGWFVIVGTIPIVIAGVALKDVIENEFRSLWIVAVTFITFGIVLGIADRIGRRDRAIASMTVKHAFVIGLAQMAALVPGVSRSGATISMTLLLGYDRVTAARFAFLLAIPAVLGAGVYEWPTAIGADAQYGVGPIVAATIVAFVVAYSVIAWLFRWLETRTFTPFVVYRVVVGSLVLGLLAAGVLTP